MNAYLFDVKRYYSGEEYPQEQEFIVVSNNDAKRNEEANRVYQWYVNNAKPNLVQSILGHPQILEKSMVREHSQVDIDWLEIQQRQIEQHKNRPRGIGCTFRGGSPEPIEDYTKEEVEDLRGSIEYFMDEHRTSSNLYLFVGSLWRLDTRLRFGKIVLFEACGIELASDIVQLEYLSQKPETTYVNWCCPVYVA